MQELKQLISGMQMAKLAEMVREKWKEKAVEFIVSYQLYEKPHLMKQILAICDETADKEIGNLADNIQKLQAILELEQVKQNQAENQEVGVH